MLFYLLSQWKVGGHQSTSKSFQQKMKWILHFSRVVCWWGWRQKNERGISLGKNPQTNTLSRSGFQFCTSEDVDYIKDAVWQTGETNLPSVFIHGNLGCGKKNKNKSILKSNPNSRKRRHFKTNANGNKRETRESNLIWMHSFSPPALPPPIRLGHPASNHT